MSIYYDYTREEFGTSPDQCPDCGPDGDWRYDTSCAAPGCSGAQYGCCGRGCDTGLPGSRCDAAAEAESVEDRDARIDRERAAFGLAPLSGEGEK